MEVWTHGRWVVKPGREDEFVEAWRGLAERTAEEFPGAHGVLLRDRDKPNRFYSFGPWESSETVERWRGSTFFREGIGNIRELLDDFTAHTLDPAAKIGSW